MFFDFLGAIISLTTTYFFIRLDYRAWVLSFLATTFHIGLYWSKGIYADMGLEVYYFLTACYGWYYWGKPKKSRTREIEQCYVLPLKQGLALTILGFILFILIRQTLLSLNSNVANLDALTSTLSIIAQWLMCRKMIATWMLWLVTDAIYALLYLKKGLPFHTLLMVIYTVLAVAGYWRWQKHLSSGLRSKDAENFLMEHIPSTRD